MQQDRNHSLPPEGAQPTVNIGNASNPSAADSEGEPMSDNQILTEGAEKYIREVASIEDVPDAKEASDMENASKSEKPQE